MTVAVIGGGVVGLACAIRLAEAGRRVTLFESDPGLSAPSWNNAGHIAVEQVAPLASAATLRSIPRRHVWAGGALDLPLRQVAAWAPFAARLVAASRPARFAQGSRALGGLLGDAMPAWQRLAALLGDPDLIRADGHLIRWDSAASAERGRAAWAWADTGAATLLDPTATDRAVVAALVGDDANIARSDGSGHVRDLAALAGVMRETLVRLGGAIVTERARLDVARGRVAVAGHDADTVLVAAGIASGALLRPLGHRVPIVAERGYHIRAAADGWPADAPPIVFEDRSMIVTRFATCVQAASFVEFARADAPPDPRKWERLERHVAGLGLPMRGPFARWVGARPTLPDYLPAIGRSRRARNLYYAFGHQHLGLTLAAVTAERVAGSMAGEGGDLTPFDLARFERKWT